MTRGFLLGKFLPPHEGHVFLGQFGRHHCDELTILVCTLDRDPIPGELRHTWMKELFPNCRVVHHSADVPQEPADHPDFWSIWRRIAREAHPEPIDFVYASESYGQRLAAEVHADFVPVDPPRDFVSISGSAIRSNPFAHWDKIPVPVRPYFAKKVCVFGPESTGKTTLAHWLANRFSTSVVPEYGRIYTDTFGTDLPPDAFEKIAKGHIAATAAALRRANRLLVMDTDPVLTAVWSDMLLNSRSPALDSFTDVADLYLLTDIDVPWVDDGTRYFPEAGRRTEFFARCRTELQRRRLPYVVLSGGWSARSDRAESAIRETFFEAPPIS